MAFGELGIAKTVAMNVPKKIRRIVEPFGDRGTVALFPGMKRAKEHLVNVEDETLFAIFSFIQTLNSADKRQLKGFDWVASPETFDAALAITATEGAELYYKFNYTGRFGERAADPEEPPTLNDLRFGHDMKNILFTLPATRVGLKRVTLTNEDPLSVLNAAGGGGPGTFLVLVPHTPETVEAVEGRLGSLTTNYFYAKKSASNEELFEAVDAAVGSDVVVSTFADSTIMSATMQVRTNYEHKPANKLVVLEPIEEIA